MSLSLSVVAAVAVATVVVVVAATAAKEEKEEVNTDDDIEEESRLKIEPKYCIFCISVTFEIIFLPFFKSKRRKVVTFLSIFFPV